MRDFAHLLADLGAASVGALWLPVLAWTALALLSEATLRLARVSASVGLGVRGALVALLPAALVVPSVLARWIPSIQPSRTAVSLPVENPVALAVGAASGDAGAMVPAGNAAARLISSADLALGVAVVGVWVAAIAALGALAGGIWWLGRYRRDLAPAGDALAADARALAGDLGIRRPVQLAWAEPETGPFTVGWWRPVIALPPDLRGESLRMALAHEMAHVREGHYGWALAERVVRAVFVWHPLVHVLGRSLALDRERAADAAVVRLWPERVQSYGRLLHAVASRPSPALALGASTSSLVHRLTAMTRPIPDRPRRARLLGVAVLIVPLIAAASAVPDAQQVPPPPAPPAAPSAPTPDDSLAQYIESVNVWKDDDDARIELRLREGTSRAVAEAIADQLSEGGRPGELAVVGDGFRIERSTLRDDAFPPPPPPPPAPEAPDAAPAPPPPPPPAPASPPSPPRPATEVLIERSDSDRDIVPPPPPPQPNELTVDELERMVAALRQELLDVEQEIDALGPPTVDASPEQKALYIQLDVRQSLVTSRYRLVVGQLEERRLGQILTDARQSN